MSQIRPKILVSYGRENAPLQVPLVDQIVQSPVCILANDTQAGASTLVVTSTFPFDGIDLSSGGFYAILGIPGQPNAEVIEITSTTDTALICSDTVYPHSASTPITFLPYLEVYMYHSDTPTSVKTLIANNLLVNPATTTTDYTDTAYTDGYYFAQLITDVGIGGIGNDAAFVNVVSFDNIGTGYHVGDVLNIIGGFNDATVRVTQINGGGGITGFVVVTSGSGYIAGTFSVGGGFGTGATFTIGGFLSPYSDPVPYASYTLLSARSIIDTALGEINKQTSEVLSDEFAFQQLDMFQTDVLRELKRWSFMQKFDAIIGQFEVGQWKLPLPDGTTLPAIDDKDTNKSIYNIRVGTNGRMTWIDKAKWDDFIFNLAYSTLSVDLTIGATTMTLVNSGDFTHLTPSNTQGSGTVIIGANSYDYSANDTATGILTLTTAITSANTATAGQDVFQNTNQGLPTYYTIFDNTVWYWPITSNEYDGLNAFMDYYIKQTRIQKDSDEIVVPDPQCASYFLQWKFLKKMNNGQEDSTTLIQKQNYMDRRNTLKNKEVLNRTFKNHARYQNFAIQEQWSSGDPRYIRDGNFPNTGF